MVIALIHNLAFLVALVVAYQFIFGRWNGRGWPSQVLSGVLFGTVAMVSMASPFVFQEGILIDGRSIVLSVAGFFGGPVVAVVAAMIAASYRFALGGAGMPVGVAVVIASSAIGVIFYYMRRRHPPLVDHFRLWIFGMIVHLVVVAILFLVPQVGPELVRTAGLQVLVLFPVATWLLSRFFLEQEQRAETERSFRESERRLATLMSNLPGMVYRSRNDEHRTQEFVSEGCRELTGYTVEEFLVGGEGRLASLLHPDDLRRVLQETEIAVREKRSFLLQYRIVTADGTVKNVEERGRPVLNASGQVAALEGFILDITEREKAAQERIRLEDELRQALKMEAVGRLAGGVAHDFNNMLSIINGYTDLALMECGPNATVREYLSAVKQAGNHSADLTRQLLTFARKQPIHPEVVDLNAALAVRLDMLKRVIGEEVRLVWQPGKAVGAILIDPMQLDQVLINLVINARDAMDAGGTVTIKTDPFHWENTSPLPPLVEDMAPGRYAALSIEDNGRGIPEDILPHIFEPFFTTRTTGEGTGLGLATVYGVLSQNNARVAVKSTPRVGTEFRIFFPSAEGAETPAPMAAPLQEMPTPARKIILLVEDEASVLRLARLILEKLGYTVFAASGPGEAQKLAADRRDEIDLLVTDIIMPEMNGYELWRRLNNVRPLRCLFLSGYTADIIHQRGLLIEKMHFLEKPFTTEMFATKVREALDDPPPQGN